jgi:hypothetical protein
MAIEHYSVRLLSDAGKVAEGTFSLDNDLEECQLAFNFPGGQFCVTASDYFEALCQIRNELETNGWRPICYGSSKDVYPSGMARDMGCRGLKAYRLQIGEPAKLADLVEIFDSAPDMEPASVAEQEQFFERWLRSQGIER